MLVSIELKRTTLKSYITLILAVALIACDSSDNKSDSFDRTALLQNMADNLIEPQFITLQTKVATLNTAANTFTADATNTTLDALQAAWVDAYTAWQYANAFNFGPAGEEGLRKNLSDEVALFPVDTKTVESSITANNTALNDSHRDARGFLAVEYLIYGTAGDEEVLEHFTSTNRQAYLTALTAKLKTQIDNVVTGWSGGYSAEFVSADGTDVGSSTSRLYNEFVRSFESIKNFKVGLPLGARPGQTRAEPQLVEAYYSGSSLPLIKEHLTAIENIWLGRAKDGADGIGFKEYLETVTGGPALITATEAQLVKVKAALNALPAAEPLSVQVANSPAAVETFYTELQNHTHFYKGDMSSLLGIAITFASGDGD